MSTESKPAPRGGGLPRLYLREPGWRVAVKAGSEREFCYMVAPGQDYYHRLLDGEVFLTHGEEKLCLACADRRGLLAFEAKPLRDPVATISIPADVDDAAVFRIERPGQPAPPS
ncbi:MAG TPA: hypothetical protein VF590_09850 [Isosphaeraceae bacterium]|jgi:hypothetical protein